MRMSRLVTIFGGGGFLGRYVAQELLKAGARIRIAERDPSDAWFLKPLGGLGQTQFVPASVTHPASLAHACEGADAVVNLVGILKGDFDAIQRRGASNVAAAANYWKPMAGEQPQQVLQLAVNVAAHCHRRRDRLHSGLLHKKRLDHVAEFLEVETGKGADAHRGSRMPMASASPCSSASLVRRL